MSSNDFLDKGIALVKQATQEDEAEDYAAAFRVRGQMFPLPLFCSHPYSPPVPLRRWTFDTVYHTPNRTTKRRADTLCRQ